MNRDLTSAILFTTAVHLGQVRKFTGEDYIVHPLAVMTKVSYESRDIDVLSAAILHDVVKDTKTTLEDVRRIFGIKVSTLVDAITHRKSEPTTKYIKRIADAGADVVLIKKADMEHNITSLPKDERGDKLREKYDIASKLLLGYSLVYPDKKDDFVYW
jgi:GTP pyrophosphokinase